MDPRPGALTALHPAPRTDLPHVARIAGAPVVPWRNGRGTTRLLHPRDGEADGWWVSVADLVEAGDFSAFPGVERVLTALDADVDLTVDGVVQHVHALDPCCFDGGASVSAELPDGPGRALNVFADRARCRVDVRVRRAHEVVHPGAALVVLEGSAHLADGRDLGPLDLVAGPALVRGTVLVIDVVPTSRRSPQ